jgi:hypothetical protein
MKTSDYERHMARIATEPWAKSAVAQSATPPPPLAGVLLAASREPGLGHSVGANKKVAKKRGMDQWEAEYAQRLEMLRLARDIDWWKFEGVRFKLADGAWFKPDFIIFMYDANGAEGGIIEAHEVKGHWREAAKVRLKVARELYPWVRFRVMRKVKGNWIEEL